MLLVIPWGRLEMLKRIDNCGHKGILYFVSLSVKNIVSGSLAIYDTKGLQGYEISMFYVEIFLTWLR